MKTITGLLIASLLFSGCSTQDSPLENDLIFKSVSATTGQPITDCKLQILEKLDPYGPVLTTINCNALGEFKVPLKYNGKLGNLVSPKYQKVLGISLKYKPIDGKYLMEPLYWTIVHLKIGADSIYNFIFSPWRNWFNLQPPGIDTVFSPIPHQVRKEQYIGYLYSLKSDPGSLNFKKVPVQAAEFDTLHVFINH